MWPVIIVGKVAFVIDPFFLSNYRFDGLRIRMGNARNPFSILFGHESVKDMVQKFVFLGDDRNIVQIWVDGKIVKNVIAEKSLATKLNGFRH